MMNIKKYIGLALLPMVFTACQEDTLVNDQAQGIYTLKATVDQSAPMSRAQVVLGGTSTTTETFRWNAGDEMMLLDVSNVEDISKHSFTISSSYDGNSVSADFTTSKALTEGHPIVAIYPTTFELDSNYGYFIQMDVAGHVLDDNSEVSWIKYFSENMFMIATGTASEGMGLKMQHLCSLIRVTYTNATDSDVKLSSITLNGDICTNRTFHAGDTSYDAGHGGTSDHGIRFANPVTIGAGETEDFYILTFAYFDHENINWEGLTGFNFSYPEKSDASTPTTYNGQDFVVSDLKAGSSYWFNITETADGLVWTKDVNQGEEEDVTVTFSNKEFSKALYAVLGADKVSFDADSCGVMTQANVDEVTSLNFNDYADKANITSLDGIENFVNLQNLSCSGTALSYVKLTNSELHTVELTHNQLEKIDISSLTSLQKLDVNNNKLNDAGINIVSPLLTEFYFNSTAITFASIPDECIANITWMNCGDTGLSGTVDLSAFTSLGGLYIAENNIENLILPENNKISLLDVSGNGREMEGVATVDLTRCPNLWYFSSQYANFASLDFSNCPNIEHLYCNDNFLSELDLRNNEKIGLLYCGGQRENVTLKLTLPKSLEEKWTNEWAGQNERVDVNFVDASEEVATVTIENAELAVALQDVLGTDKVTINEKGFAVMKESDVLAVTSLNFGTNNYTITSLSGIEYFTNLEALYCSGTNLSECDLSKNLQLRDLMLFYNKLTTLDLGNLTHLGYLGCCHSESLKEVILTNCENLSFFECNETSIEAINVPNVESLTHLYCGDNPNLKIDLNSFPNLISLGFSGMGITEVNLSDYIKKQLTWLSVQSNQLSSLDLSEYPNLKTLHCSGNNLTSLNLAAVPYLECLTSTDNKISTLDITTLSKLTDLRCGSQQDDINLTLTMTEEQKLTWDSTWASNNANVTLNVVSSGNAGGGVAVPE